MMPAAVARSPVLPILKGGIGFKVLGQTGQHWKTWLGEKKDRNQELEIYNFIKTKTDSMV